jgi:hypothetical protein
MRWNCWNVKWTGKITPKIDFGNDYSAGKQLSRPIFQFRRLNSTSAKKLI